MNSTLRKETFRAFSAPSPLKVHPSRCHYSVPAQLQRRGYQPFSALAFQQGWLTVLVAGCGDGHRLSPWVFIMLWDILQREKLFSPGLENILSPFKVNHPSVILPLILLNVTWFAKGKCEGRWTSNQKSKPAKPVFCGLLCSQDWHIWKISMFLC